MQKHIEAIKAALAELAKIEQTSAHLGAAIAHGKAMVDALTNHQKILDAPKADAPATAPATATAPASK